MNPSSSLFTKPILAPYPGLRPFQPHESPIFFGRREHVADMLTVLENQRFLAVVGPSGGGKSSLVLAGLLPALERGELLTARSDAWRFVILRPGDDPFSALARAAQRRLPDEASQGFHDGDPDLTELVLRGSPFGFVEVLRDARVPDQTNVLLLVDQFEELFRFRAPDSVTPAAGAQRRDDAAAFVQLLLETARQARRPVQVMLTMRTDFLGDCDVFDGLPEAINQSQYLTPRLNLAQLSEAIREPIRRPPFSGSVAPELVQRILNDVGTGRDELPVVQHVLFRAWQQRKPGTATLTLDDYGRAGRLEQALSQHADEVLKEFRDRGQERLVRRVFSSLAEVGANGQYLRRPVTIEKLADETGYSATEVITVVDAFRRSDRCFLVAAPDRELAATDKVDISHESLLRQWTTLRGWIEEESASAATFMRLRDAAARWPKAEPLLRDPALGLALDWVTKQQPQPKWAKRYGGGLERTLEYLEKSQEERERETQEKEDQRRRELERLQAWGNEQEASARRFRLASFALFVFFVVAVAAAGWAWAQRSRVLSLNQSLEEMNDNVRLLKGDQLFLSNEVARLQVEKQEVEASRVGVVEDIRALREKEASLTAEQQRLQVFNEALAAIVAAHGAVLGAGTGAVTVAFHESEISLDPVLPLLDRVGNVEALRLSRTRLSDAALSNLTDLPRLKSLDLSFTDVTDEGMAHVGGLVSLTNLVLNDTLITQAGLMQLARLTNLAMLELSRNQVTEAAVEALGGNLPVCRITYVPDPLLEALASTAGDLEQALKAVPGASGSGGELVFFDSPITDAALRKLGEMAEVTSLDLSYCQRITNDGLKHLGRRPALVSLELSSCSQISDAGMGNLNLTNLKSLVLDSISLTERALPAIYRATNLTRLVLSSPDVDWLSDDGLAGLPRLAELEHLELKYHGALTGRAIAHILRLRKLRSLDLTSSEGIPVSAYPALAELSLLRELNLSYTYRMADEGLIHLEKLTRLERLDLTECKRLSQAGVHKLRNALPNTAVQWSPPGAPDETVEDAPPGSPR